MSTLQNIPYFGSTICYIDGEKFDCYMRELTAYLSKFENFLLKNQWKGIKLTLFLPNLEALLMTHQPTELNKAF